MVEIVDLVYLHHRVRVISPEEPWFLPIVSSSAGESSTDLPRRPTDFFLVAYCLLRQSLKLSIYVILDGRRFSVAEFLHHGIEVLRKSTSIIGFPSFRVRREDMFCLIELSFISGRAALIIISIIV